MKVRLTNEQIGALAANLISCPGPGDFEALDHVDDTSRQTLETLISQCPYCGEFTRLEDGEICGCSQSDLGFYEDDITFSLENGYHNPCELEELPEE